MIITPLSPSHLVTFIHPHGGFDLSHWQTIQHPDSFPLAQALLNRRESPKPAIMGQHRRWSGTLVKSSIWAALGILLFGGSDAGCAFAAEPAGIRELAVSPETLYRPDRFELRGGGFSHCCHAESGSFALGLELVTPRLFTLPALLEFFSPRFQFGGIVDLNGHTSYGYAGLLFTHNITKRIFVEPFFGVAVSNGVAAGDAVHNAIGCTTLIHSGGNIGYRLDQEWSVMFTFDHISNGNLCNRNVGVNNYGGKIGYNF